LNPRNKISVEAYDHWKNKTEEMKSNTIQTTASIATDWTV